MSGFESQPDSGHAAQARAAGEHLLDRLRALERDSEMLEADDLEPLHDELLEHFADCAEAKELESLHAAGLVLHYAAEQIGMTAASLGPAELAEIVFEIIPRKVAIEAREAQGIVAELRAFYRFLQREFALAQAEPCLRVLGGDAATRLEEALSDPRNFGMAKSMVMAGREAGADVETEEGLRAWMRSLQSNPLPPSFELPASAARARPRPPALSAKARKAQRKAARKARKRNR